MNRNLLLVSILILAGCSKDYEPKLSGQGAYTFPPRTLVIQNMGGEETRVRLPGGNSIRYRFAQWTKSDDELLVAQIKTDGDCDDFQIVTINTDGTILDTVYQALPSTQVNFKLAPNDSVLLLKTYDDDCGAWSGNFKYSFYNRYLKTGLPDTITVNKAQGLLLDETVWSPDSKKVIIPEWSGPFVKAFVYDLVTGDTTFIDKGSNFVWSPIDNEQVTYIKDYSIIAMNIRTRQKELIYQGKKKKGARRFRWNPTGEFLRIHVQSYILNIEAPMTRRTVVMYLSMHEKTTSRTYLDDQKIETWK